MIRTLAALTLSWPMIAGATDIVKECDMFNATMVAYKKFVPSSGGMSQKAYVVEHGDSFTYIDTLGIKYRSGPLQDDHGDLAYEDKENSIVYSTNKKRSVYAVIYPEQERARVLKNCIIKK